MRNRIREEALWYAPLARTLAARWIRRFRHVVGRRRLVVGVEALVGKLELVLGLGGWVNAVRRILVGTLNVYPSLARLVVEDFLAQEKALLAEIEILGGREILR